MKRGKIIRELKSLALGTKIHGLKPIFKESGVVNAILCDKLNLVLQIIKKVIRKRLQGMSLNYHQK